MNLERIYWKDIGSLSDAWKTKEELADEGLKSFATECITVGEVVFENQDFVVVAASFDGDDRYHDASMIMKSVISKREKI